MEETRNEVVSVGNWIVTYLIFCIPFVNLIMLFVWAFGGGTPASKANWAKALLIWMVIGIVIYALMFIVFGASFLAASAAAA